jgi:hypothetical protein
MNGRVTGLDFGVRRGVESNTKRKDELKAYEKGGPPLNLRGGGHRDRGHESTNRAGRATSAFESRTENCDGAHRSFWQEPRVDTRQHRFALMREKTAAGVVIITNNSTATKSLMYQRMTLSWSRNRWMHERGRRRVSRSTCRRPIKAMLHRGASYIASAGHGCSVLFKLPWVSVTRSLVLWRAGEGQAGTRAKPATPRFPACHDGMMS